MSDGPHRSLQMRPRWKDLAERAATPAYDLEQVNEVLPVALAADFNPELVADVVEILRGPPQSSLFDEARTPQLEALRNSHPADGAVATLLDCASEAIANGARGEEAALTAVANAVEAHAGAGCRQIKEHYQRKGAHTAEFGARLDAALKQCAYKKLASELSSGRPRAGGSRLRKRSDVDEGPPL